jgi:hypothetical protein
MHTNQCCHGSADVFSENGYTVPNKFSKILEIFDEIEELKS